jgi:hypothetical protein
MSHDPHGQPFNIRFNRARRAERDLSEFLGLAKGLLADGAISIGEADTVHAWIERHPDAVEQWPLNRLAERLTRMYADGRIDDSERRELADLLGAIVGGQAGVLLGEDAPTTLPLSPPPIRFQWTGATVVFTGKFAFGTRAECQRVVAQLGAASEADVTRRTQYLIIGTFGSRDWAHTSFGRKIQKAVEYRGSGQYPIIAAEEHWIESVQPAR